MDFIAYNEHDERQIQATYRYYVFYGSEGLPCERVTVYVLCFMYLSKVEKIRFMCVAVCVFLLSCYLCCVAGAGETKIQLKFSGNGNH